MTILDLARVCNVNTLFVVRDALRETDVEIGTAAMILTLSTGSEAQIAHIDVNDNTLFITLGQTKGGHRPPFGLLLFY